MCVVVFFENELISDEILKSLDSHVKIKDEMEHCISVTMLLKWNFM